MIISTLVTALQLFLESQSDRDMIFLPEVRFMVMYQLIHYRFHALQYYPVEYLALCSQQHDFSVCFALEETPFLLVVLH